MRFDIYIYIYIRDVCRKSPNLKSIETEKMRDIGIKEDIIVECIIENRLHSQPTENEPSLYIS